MKLSSSMGAIVESAPVLANPLIALFAQVGGEGLSLASPNGLVSSEIGVYGPGSDLPSSNVQQREALVLSLDVETLCEVAEETVDGGMSRLRLRTGEGQSDPPLALLISAVQTAIYNKADENSALPMARAIAARLIQSHSTDQQLRYTRFEPEASVCADLRPAIRYLRDHIDRNVTLAELSGVANKSVSALSRLFVAETGSAPHQYLIQLRLAKAKALLQTTDLPLFDIADACGFSHVEHLARIFRRHTGFSPGVYRVRLQTRGLD
ncbi:MULTISPECIES: AraC family transcriptional regulator [unclassified Devosia]|uniref:helix-turn-helix domain-containing protein n=1 Tax=unclassified Devosia TaxID=196773 RepID=UPI0015FB7439|nr:MULTISPECIES: AraC family transcriptional regulator [unclassified Devosia]MBJ6987835.1 helix-turn-helix transcriptional regulator [Devosia sp. MC521]MBK1796166.1 helix-turn-helix transcriptional regulator [Devosia sp. WQ 349K1]QMW63741.1 helix-turn-helix transcriptional regulator [Devosia sp. MC521]